MIPKPAIPVQVTRPEEVRVEVETLGSPTFGDFQNMVARWNTVSMQWELPNGTTMDCQVSSNNMVDNILVTEE